MAAYQYDKQSHSPVHIQCIAGLPGGGYAVSERFVSVRHIAAMIALIFGLIYFLREVTKATRSSQIGMEIAVDDINREESN